MKGVIVRTLVLGHALAGGLAALPVAASSRDLASPTPAAAAQEVSAQAGGHECHPLVAGKSP